MRRRISTLGLALVLVSACRVPAAPTVSAKGAAPTLTVATPAPTNGPLATAPIAGASPLLQKPQTPSRVLTGVVSLDATYLVGAGGGTVVSAQGGTLASRPAADLGAVQAGSAISAIGGAAASRDGRFLVAADGATLVASGGGNLIVPDPAALLAADGVQARGGIVSNNGAAVVSNNGSRVIGNHGAGVIGNNGGSLRAPVRRRTLAADGVGSVQLPAAGMWLRAISMADNTAVPLGVDAANNPVFVVATDANGQFKLYLPADVAENVRIVASVPHAADPRLTYEHLVSTASTGTLTLDEGQALLTDHLRGSLYARLADLVTAGRGSQALAGLIDPANPAGQATIARFQQAATAAGYDTLPVAGQVHVAQRLADEVLAKVDLVGGGGAVASIAPADQASLLDVLQELTARADHLLHGAWGEAGFVARPWVVAAVQRHGSGAARVVFKKTSDVDRFVIDEYLGTGDAGRAAELTQAFVDLGLAPARADLVTRLTVTIQQALGLQLIADVDALTRRLPTLVAAERAARVASPAPAPSVAITAVTAPSPGPVASHVQTIVGNSGGPFPLEGPGVSAVLEGSFAIAADGQGHLYVGGGSTVRVVDLRDPLHPVTILTGTHGAVLDHPGVLPKDGPKGVATFAFMRAFTTDGHHLYLTETPPDASGLPAPGVVVRAVDLDDPQHPTTTVAGRYNEPGDQDGPGADARFRQPEDLVLDPDGNLLVADTGNALVRKIDLHAPGFPVSTVLGQRGAPPTGPVYDGPAASTPLVQPLGLAFGRDRRLVLLDSNLVRRVDADGILRVVAGGFEPGTPDGYWMDGRLNMPEGLVALPTGDFAVIERGAGRVRGLRLDALGMGGTIWTMAGVVSDVPAIAAVLAPGPAATAHFNGLYHGAVDGQGHLFLSGNTGGSLIQVDL